MRELTKIWLIIAALCILVGASVFTAMLANANWDFSNLSTEKFQTQAYTSVSPITDISIDTTTASITLCFTQDDTATVVCKELENAPHSVSFENGNLTVNQQDNRAWYDHIGVHFSAPEITIYLPEKQYGALNINVTTGDIHIPNGFTFRQMNIVATTCDVDLGANVTGSLAVKVTTGDIEITDAAFGSVALITTTGKTELTNVKSDIIYSSGSTGDIYLENVIATKNLNITRSTGDVTFKDSDAEAIYIEVSTGNVTGSLLTGKIFSVTTNTGKISVPENTPGSTCVITSSTGDIRISVN